MQERHLREDSMGRDEQADEGNRERRGNGSQHCEGEQLENAGGQARSRAQDSRSASQFDHARKTNGRVAGG